MKQTCRERLIHPMTVACSTSRELDGHASMAVSLEARTPFRPETHSAERYNPAKSKLAINPTGFRLLDDRQLPIV